jgi:FkbM family methyltransferase
MSIAGALRGALFPFRWAVTSLPRGSLLRSASVPILKLAASKPSLLRDLPDIRPLDRPDISFESIDSMVLDDVYWFGVQGYEGILAHVWGELCRDACSVLEVGANIGFYSVIGGSASTAVYTAVEPVPKVAAALRANLIRNRLRHVEVLEGAVIPDATRRPVTLNLPNEGRAAPVGAHLVADSEVEPRSSLEVLTVQGLPIGELAQGRDLIKIDAEGIEHALLRAAMPILLERPPTIVVEVLPQSHKLAEVVSELAIAAGYTIHVVPEYGSTEIISVSPALFTAQLRARHRSKDVILARHRLV